MCDTDLNLIIRQVMALCERVWDTIKREREETEKKVLLRECAGVEPIAQLPSLVVAPCRGQTLHLLCNKLTVEKLPFHMDNADVAPLTKRSPSEIGE